MFEMFKGPAAETGEKGLKKEEGEEMAEVDFENLKKGDKLVVETGDDEGGISKYEIIVDGKTKHALRVSVRSEWGKEIEEFTARMMGGLTMEKGETRGLIKVSGKEEKNCLYFQNLKDAKTELRAGARRTRPIGKIVVIKKEEKKER